MSETTDNSQAGGRCAPAPCSVSPEDAMRKFHEMHAKCGSLSDPFDDEDDDCNYDPFEDPDWCSECQGSGKVVTADYESYFGANYKPCPKCGGDPCVGEPPCS